jgi:hypothetical protein
MNEKENIEYYTALEFLKLYNKEYNTSYRIDKCTDAPDILCVDDNENILKLEITLAEDKDKDIKALLGHSDHKSIDKAKFNSQEITLFDRDVLPRIIKRIKKKLLKDYGNNTALVIKHTSPLPWKFKWHIDDIRESISSIKDNYDKGIWIINLEGNKLYRII